MKLENENVWTDLSATLFKIQGLTGEMTSLLAEIRAESSNLAQLLAQLSADQTSKEPERSGDSV